MLEFGRWEIGTSNCGPNKGSGQLVGGRGQRGLAGIEEDKACGPQKRTKQGGLEENCGVGVMWACSALCW